MYACIIPSQFFKIFVFKISKIKFCSNKNKNMPTSVTVLCQIKSKKLDGGFVTGLASYMVSKEESIDFCYGFYKKQISSSLHDLEIGNCMLICGKCVFDKANMHVNTNSYCVSYSLIIIKKKILIFKSILKR